MPDLAHFKSLIQKGSWGLIGLNKERRKDNKIKNKKKEGGKKTFLEARPAEVQSNHMVLSI